MTVPMAIRTNSERLSIYNQRGWKRSDPIPDYIYDIRKALVENNIITHAEIIKCSTEFIRKIERHLPNPNRPRRLKRCHYVNRCPICNHLRTLYVEKEMTPYRQTILDNGGKNILMTFKLRHKNDSLLKLQNVLKESIKKLKDDNIWKNILFPSKYRLYVQTEFEISWSNQNGFHPHCHLQIGTTNPMESEEIKTLVAPVWKRIVTDVSPNKYFIPNLTNGVDVRESLSGRHSEDKDDYGMDTLKKLHKRSKQQMKERFNESNTDTTRRFNGSYSHLEMQSNLGDIFIPILKEIYQKTIKSFRRLFLNINSHHDLFSKITPKVK
jgi:hypothetical protein